MVSVALWGQAQGWPTPGCDLNTRGTTMGRRTAKGRPTSQPAPRSWASAAWAPCPDQVDIPQPGVICCVGICCPFPGSAWQGCCANSGPYGSSCRSSESSDDGRGASRFSGSGYVQRVSQVIKVSRRAQMRATGSKERRPFQVQVRSTAGMPTMLRSSSRLIS